MEQKFCNSCGSELSEGIKFCENCGTKIDQKTPLQPQPPPVSMREDPVTTPPVEAPPSAGSAGKVPVKIIAGIIIVLVIAAALIFTLLPKISSGSDQSSTGLIASTGTVSSTITIPVTTVPITTAPTPAPDPFPNALLLKDGLPFGEGSVESEGTVYRIWMNETYSWHNDMDNKYYLQKPKPGNKYLFVFVCVFNKGDNRVWPPTSGNIQVNYNGQKYSPDPNHYLPDKLSDRDATAIEVKEVQFFSKLFGTEYVEDYGYSHGAELAYLYPGKSNAIDGYLVYEVPSSLTPEKAYVEIAFNANTVGVWKLG
ncbi:MAG: zinc-ribbon domain-containing protein [Methanoregula sp.]|jgi:hypothetical protein|nr:zinc-ribbon domain-containing protein [Methanoregula sp.]